MKLIITVLLALVLIISGCVGQSSEAPDDGNEAPMIAIVEMSESGFSSSTVTIAKGGTVTFRNTGSENHWPASAVHPVHSQYPEGGGCIGSAFDACEGISSGGEWSFRFDKIGVWGYHDHLNPPNRGVVEVVE